MVLPQSFSLAKARPAKTVITEIDQYSLRLLIKKFFVIFCFVCVFVYQYICVCAVTCACVHKFSTIFFDILLHYRNIGIGNSDLRLLSKNIFFNITLPYMHNSTKCKISNVKDLLNTCCFWYILLAVVVNPSPNFDTTDGEAKCKKYTGCSMCWLFDQEKNGQVIDYVTKRYGVLTYVR